MSSAVQQYFMNGGAEASIVRTAHLSGAGTAARKAQVAIGGTGSKTLTLEGADEGAWADALRVRIDHDTKDKDEATPVLFNLLLKDVSTGAVEVLRDLPPDPSLGALLEQQSTLVRASSTLPTARPDGQALIDPGEDPFDPAVSARFTAFPGRGAANASLDGDQDEDDLVPAADDGTGVYSLGRADLFNLLCIPPFLPPSDPGAGRVLTAPKKALAAGERDPQPTRGQLPADVPRRRQRRLGRPNAGRGRHARLRVEVHPGPPPRPLPRGEPVPRHEVGGLRAERRAAVGADPPQRRRLHARSLSEGRVPGHDAEGRLPRQVRQGDDDSGGHRQRRGATFSSGSRHSSRRSS